MVPNRLTDWTFQTLETLCAAGQSESDRHDFKLGLQDPRNTTKLCCAFANTFGGFLVIGVREQERKFTIEGVDPDKELYGHLIDKIRCDPEIAITLPHTIPITGSSKVVYVFEIPQSARRPHLPSPDVERFFWKRQGSKCERMTLEEVRYQMSIYEEKRDKLMLLMIELNHIKRSVTEQADLPDGSHDGTVFRFDIIDRVIVESFSIIKTDPNLFGALDTLKKRLMLFNSEKQKLLAMLSQGPYLQQRQMLIESYKRSVQDIVPGIVIMAQQIQRSLKEDFGIEDPYERK